MTKLISIVMWMAAVFGFFTTEGLYAASANGFISISGSATYRQRIAMPPDAVLTVKVEDVSRADKPAMVLAEVREVFGERQVPIPFSLNVASANINPSFRYAIRATITVGGELRFTTTRHYAVLTRGAPNVVDLLLEAVQPLAKATPAPISINAPTSFVGVALPATFVGVTPCADCTGIEQTLTLRADGLYRLRRVYQEKPAGTFAELGRWTLDAQRKRLTLLSASEMQLFEVRDDSTLRQLDRLGQPIKSAANLDLHRSAQVDPINDSLKLHGEFRYLADAATFTDCVSGKHWPVAMSEDYLAMERNYLQVGSGPAEPLLVSFEGRIEVIAAMEGPPNEQILVERFDGSQPGASCRSPAFGKDKVMAELKNTYWKLIGLDGEKVAMMPTQKREVRITLSSEGSRLIGFSGCNQLVGSYVQDGGALLFTVMAGNLMACVSPFMELENTVLRMLGATTGYRIEGERLILLGGDQVLARFEAVYLK